jgi:chromate transporter
MTAHDNSVRLAQPIAGSPFEVFRVFLKLGLTSFGGLTGPHGVVRLEC